MYGPGICEGKVGEKGVFTIETAEAGSGQMSVRVRGPKKSFDVRTQPHPTIDYAIIVEYNPTQTGSYVVEVEWSGVHVTGSPFMVNVVDSTEVYCIGGYVQAFTWSIERKLLIITTQIIILMHYPFDVLLGTHTLYICKCTTAIRAV